MKTSFPMVGCAIAAIVLLTACSNAPKAGSPGKAAQTYMTYAYERNFEQFANAFVFASDTIEADRHEANVKAAQALLEEKGDEHFFSMDSVSEIRVLTEDIDETGTWAKVTLETAFRNGLRDTTHYTLIKSGKDWKFYEDK